MLFKSETFKRFLERTEPALQELTATLFYLTFYDENKESAFFKTLVEYFEKYKVRRIIKF